MAEQETPAVTEGSVAVEVDAATNAGSDEAAASTEMLTAASAVASGATAEDSGFAEAIAQNFDESINLESPHSIGVDIVEIERMRMILERTPRFKKRVFSEEERAYCDKKGRPECHYATRFAAKEAVLKALGTGFTEGIGVRDIEVVLNAKGKPQVKLYNRAAEKAAELEIKDIPISLSYTQDDAVACALALVNEPDEQPKPQDPLQDLHRQFKEVRSMLDTI